MIPHKHIALQQANVVFDAATLGKHYTVVPPIVFTSDII